MSNFIRLLKINIKSIFTMGQSKKKHTKFIMPIILGLLLVISVLYSVMFASMLKEGGNFQFIIIFFTMLSVLVLFVLFISSATNNLYKNKDASILFPLPLKRSTIIMSKYVSLLISGIMYEAFLLAPAGIVYFAFAGFNFVGFISLLLSLVLIPILPLALCVVISSLISLLLKKIKYKNLFSILGLFLFFGIFSYLYLNLDFESIFSQGASQKVNSLITYLPTIKWVILSIVNNNAIYLLYTILISVAAFIFSVWFVNLTYFKMCSVNASSSNAKGKMFYNHNFCTISLIKKEIKRYFSSPIYVFNSFLGAILVLGASVYFVIDKSMINIIGTIINVNQVNLSMIFAILLSILILTSSITSISISIERTQLDILKSMPISHVKLFFSKIAMGFIVCAPFILCAAIILCIGYQLGIIGFLIILLMPLLFNIFSGVFGLFVNLLFPNMHTINDTVLVKQSLSSFLGFMVPSLVFGVAVAVYAFKLSSIISLTWFAVILVAVMLVLTAAMVWYLICAGKQKLKNIN